MLLSDLIRAIVFAFDRDDSRRQDIRFLADLVQNLQHAAQEHLDATQDHPTDTWTALKRALDHANSVKFPNS